MQKSNEDCYYFLTASCAKGPLCPYRHNPLVLTCNVICPAWSRGNCIDPNCSLRHSVVQRPTITNGISCFFDNTPMGCLKSDCTYFHSRPRPTLRNSPTVRSSTTNLINKDVVKLPTAINSPSVEPAPSTPVNPPPVETPTIPEVPQVAIRAETPPRRIAIPAENEQKEVIPKITTPQPSEETKTTSQTTGNRNVVIGETANVPNRTVVHRVVVSSEPKKSPKKTGNDTDSDIDFDDLVEQESDTKKVNSLIDIPFPCSAPSITNRLFTSSKPTPPTNSTKPIRLNRDRLPATKVTISNSISSPSNGEKPSAGTGLLQDDERKLNRLERFKQQTTSPPRSVVNSTRNVINSKRPAPEQSIEESPPAKRLSSQQDNNHRHQTTATIGDLCSPPSNSRRTHERLHRRRSSSSSRSRSRSRSRSHSPSPPPLRKSSPSRSNYPRTSTMNDTAWKRQVDEFLAKTTQPKLPLPTATIHPQPVPLLSLRPRYIPPPLLQSQPVTPRPPISNPRPRQPILTTPKRPTAPVISPPKAPVQQTPITNNTPPIIPNKQDDESLLLDELDEPSDIVDTFALIDEALLGVDDILDRM